jgi:hypothetical protein
MPTIGSGITVGPGITVGSGVVQSNLVLQMDATSGISFSPNQFGYSKDIGSWMVQYGANAATLSRDTAVTDSPAGGVAMKMAVTGNDPYTATYNSTTFNIATAAAGQTWTLSVYVKASVATTGELFIFAVDSTGNAFAANTYYSATAISIGTGWTRVSFTMAIPGNATAVTNIQFRLDGPNSGGTGQNIWWDGLQLERQSSATTFNSTYNQNGLYWYDTGPNKAVGTLVNGVTWDPTVGGGSLVLNGASSQYINIPCNMSATNYTVMAAARYANTGSYTQRIISALNNNWLLGHWGSTTQNYYAEGWVSAVGTGTLDTNWRIYAGTGDIVGDSYTIYVNNVVTAGPNTGGSQGPNNFALGSYNGSSEFSSGYVGFLLVYNRVLTATEIEQNYNVLRERYGI